MALLAQVSTQKLITTVIQSGFDVSIRDNYNTPGYLTTGFLTLATSSSTEAYTFTNNSLATGSISSLGLAYLNDPDFQTGSLYLSSLYLGGIGGTVKGQLTTDATASNVYWNGTSLTSGGGGGITTTQLTSTTTGLGTLGYLSSLRYNMVISTIGTDPIFITEDYLGKKVVLTTSNVVDTVNLPDPVVVGQGWNFLVCNSSFSGGNLDVYDYTSNYLFSVYPGSSYPLCSDGGIRWLNF
jgi:hypothetical protein